jgi:hypothetical protein
MLDSCEDLNSKKQFLINISTLFSDEIKNLKDLKQQLQIKLYNCIKEDLKNNTIDLNLIENAKNNLNPEDLIEKNTLCAIPNIAKKYPKIAIQLLDALMHTPQDEVTPSLFCSTNQDLSKDKYDKLQETIEDIIKPQNIPDASLTPILPLLKLKRLENMISDEMVLNEGLIQEICHTLDSIPARDFQNEISDLKLNLEYNNTGNNQDKIKQIRALINILRKKVDHSPESDGRLNIDELKKEFKGSTPNTNRKTIRKRI